MSTYHSWVTNLLTGAVIADVVPLQIQSMSRQINGVGQLTGVLNLAANSDVQNTTYLEALEPRRSVLWVAQDGYPVWCGIIWDWTHQSISDRTLPISASTFESLFQHRHIDQILNFTGDVFDTVRALVEFAVAKTPNGQVAGLTWTNAESGVTMPFSFQAADLKKVADAINDVATTANFEYTILPSLDSNGNGRFYLQLGYPYIGAPISQTGIALVYPGNALDYGFPRTGSTIR